MSDDQLDMFAAAEKVDEWPTTDAADEHGSLVKEGMEALRAQDPPHILDDSLGDDMVYGKPVVSPAVLGAMARFLAGMIYRGDTTFDKLPAAKRKTAERAAQAAADVFANEQEDNDG